MALVDAYSKKTGGKLPYLVPEHYIDHPVLGVDLSRLPSQRAQEKPRATTSEVTKTRESTQTPPAGDESKE